MAPPASPERPNLLLFMPDQLRADAVGAFGAPAGRTPVLDELAGRGVAFSQAFAQHSVCGPSRVSMFTGWYPHVHGHRTLDHLIKPWEPNVFRALRKAGWFVAQAGPRGDMAAPGVTALSFDWHGLMVRPTYRLSPRTWDGSALADAFYAGRRGGAQDEPVRSGEKARLHQGYPLNLWPGAPPAR